MATLARQIEEPVRLRAWGRAALVLLGFLALTLVLRLGSFSRSAIDLDESFFMLLGRSLLRGDIPYTTLFEHSPIGGFALFAAIQALLGPSVLAIRIATWLSVGFTSLLVYLLAKRIANGSLAAGLIAGVLYGVFTLFNLGLAAHRELFLAPLITVAALMVLGRDGRPGALRLLIAGVATGLALQLKYMYVFEWLAVALMATLQIVLDGRRPVRAVALELLAAYLLLGVPAVLMVGGEAAYFALAGHWAEFASANFSSAASYAASQPYTLAYLVRRLFWQSRSNSLVWLGAAIAPFYLLRRPDGIRRAALLGVLGWFVLSLLGTMSTGRYWDHYYLQLVAPGSVLTGVVLAAVLNVMPAERRIERAIVLLFALAPLYALLYTPLIDTAGLLRVYARGATPPADGPVLVSDYLRPRVSPGEAIYVADYEPLVYYLVDARIPTRYAFPPHLIDPSFAIEGIPQMTEFRRIMDGRPKYVIQQTPPSGDMENQPLAKELAERLTKDYVLEKEIPAQESFSGKPIAVQIYRLK